MIVSDEILKKVTFSHLQVNHEEMKKMDLLDGKLLCQFSVYFLLLLLLFLCTENVNNNRVGVQSKLLFIEIM